MPQVHSLRLMTLNIAHGRGLSFYQGFHSAKSIERNLSRIAHLLRKVDADVVAMQEVDEDSHWNQRIHLLDSLQEAAGYPQSYLGIHNRRVGKLPLAYGNGFLSKFSIRHAERQAFGRASLGEKGFAHVELDTPFGVLPVINLHLDYRSRIRRIQQVKKLIEFLDAKHFTEDNKRHLSPIICGDFNAKQRKRADAVQHLFGYLLGKLHYKLMPEPEARTFPSLMPIHGLDFFFLPREFCVERCEVIRSYVSDHRPVVLDLHLCAESI